MRRKDRELSREEALKIADGCVWAALSVTGTDGRPYCVPINVVREGKAFYFHCAAIGEKTDALRANCAVCLTFVSDGAKCVAGKFTTDYESAIVRGTAAQLTDEGEKLAALRLLCRRHCNAGDEAVDKAVAAYPRVCVWRVAIDEITGKRNRVAP